MPEISRQVSLEDAIALIAAQARSQGARLTRTKLVKLLYFVDLRAWETFGRTITGVEWVWHHYGPYSSTVVEACDKMAANSELEVEEGSNYFGGPEYRICSSEEMYYNPPSEQLTALVRAVVSEFGKLAPAQIGDLSYETAPMRRLLQSGGRRGDWIEFEAEAPRPKDVKAAVSRYAKLVRDHQGSDEGDVAAGLREEAASLDAARRSAGSRVLAEN